MAFNSNAQNVIRAYQVAKGSLPTQDELNALSDSTSLTSFIRSNLDLKLNSATREQFVRDLYVNAGIEPDDQGVAYWADLLRGDETGTILDRAEVIMHFQAVAEADHPDSDVGTAIKRAEGGGLSGADLEFRDPTQDEDDDTGAPDFYGKITFNTTAEDRDGSATDISGDFDQELAESGSHSIFNIGLNELVGNGDAMANTTTTADYNFVVENQLGAKGLYQGLFLSPVIAPTIERDASEAILRLRVADRLAPADDVETTLDSVSVPFFTFFLNGERVRVESDAMADARNYEELFAAVEAEIARLQEAGQLTENMSVRLSDKEFREDRYVRNPDNGERTQEGEVVGREIIIETTAGELEEGTVQVISAGERGIDPVGYGLDTFTAGGRTETIETNLTLNNVGYGSQGGSINLTGQSASDKGIEKFNITATNGVWLSNIMSAEGFNGPKNKFLREIDLSGRGSFRVGDQDGQHIQLVDVVGDAIDLSTSNNVLYNVYNFNASSFNGVVELNAYINEAGLINEAVNYNLNTSGNNILNLEVAGTSSLSQENAKLDINMGNGNNTVIAEVEQSLATGADRKNLEITTGSGNDYVEIKGTGQFLVETGRANDVVFVNAEGAKGTYTLGGATGPAGQGFLWNATLTVSFAGIDVEVELDNGATTQWDINRAIKSAIQGSPLEAVLEVEDAAGTGLTFNSLIDGLNNVLDVALKQPDYGDLDAEDQDALVDALLQAGLIDSDDTTDNATINPITSGTLNATVAADTAFTNGTVVNNSVINTGVGNDVIVLSSAEDGTDNSSNTIKVTDNSGVNLTVFNWFNNDGTNDVENHVLDFTTFLNVMVRTSGSETSQPERSPTDVDDSVNSSAAVQTAMNGNPNSVINFTGINFDNDADANDSWSDLSAAALQRILRDTETTFDYTAGASFDLEDYDVNTGDTAGDTIGNNHKSVIFVENDNNDGQYKVFEVTSVDKNVTVNGLVGIFDFGDSINFADATNFA